MHSGEPLLSLDSDGIGSTLCICPSGLGEEVLQYLVDVCKMFSISADTAHPRASQANLLFCFLTDKGELGSAVE